MANIVNSGAIESEKLNAFSVRSSLANKLGLTEENAFPTTEQIDGIAEIMIDAIENLDSTLSLKRILHWHEKLFPKGYAMVSPIIGGQLRAIQLQGKKPMQVISCCIDQPTVHFTPIGRWKQSYHSITYRPCISSS